MSREKKSKGLGVHVMKGALDTSLSQVGRIPPAGGRALERVQSRFISKYFNFEIEIFAGGMRGYMFYVYRGRDPFTGLLCSRRRR